MFAKVFAVATLALAASAATIPAEKRSISVSGTHTGQGKSDPRPSSLSHS